MGPRAFANTTLSSCREAKFTLPPQWFLSRSSRNKDSIKSFSTLSDEAFYYTCALSAMDHVCLSHPTEIPRVFWTAFWILEPCSFLFLILLYEVVQSAKAKNTEFKLFKTFTLDKQNACTSVIQAGAESYLQDLCEKYNSATLPIMTSRKDGSAGQAICPRGRRECSTALWNLESARTWYVGHDCRLIKPTTAVYKSATRREANGVKPDGQRYILLQSTFRLYNPCEWFQFLISIFKICCSTKYRPMLPNVRIDEQFSLNIPLDSVTVKQDITADTHFRHGQSKFHGRSGNTTTYFQVRGLVCKRMVHMRLSL